jgi:ketosteroid isomerase-like protein
MSEENVEIAYRDYELLSRGDIETWLQDLTEDVELHELPEIPDSAVYRGHDGVRKWAAGVQELVESWHWTPEEILHESGDTLLVRVRIDLVGRGSEIPIVQILFHVLRFRDGKASAIQGFLSEHAALEAAGLRE